MYVCISILVHVLINVIKVYTSNKGNLKFAFHKSADPWQNKNVLEFLHIFTTIPPKLTGASIKLVKRWLCRRDESTH